MRQILLREGFAVSIFFHDQETSRNVSLEVVGIKLMVVGQVLQKWGPEEEAVP
jgi:hypothetical protein